MNMRSTYKEDGPRPPLIKHLWHFSVVAVLLLASIVLAGVAARILWTAFLLGWGSIQ